MSPGIKMVRFRYMTVGQRQNWYRGVQLRFTDDFVKLLAQRDGASEASFSPDVGMVCKNRNLMIDLECFYLTAIIPYDRREAGHHMIDCVRLTVNPEKIKAGSMKVAWTGTVTDVASLTNCEQGSNFQDVVEVNPRPLKDVLFETLKNLAMAGASFIPVIGPFLAIGIDLGYNIMVQYQNDAASLDAVLKAGGVTSSSITGAVILEKMKDALLKRITSLKLR
ncbi:hypothetical protein BGZ68_002966 [Mortierella alpina]|nr:hypothetical protein BGZ68_002966 [Mortierella alpina]